jgi:phosphonoacetate hydrolase
LITVNGRSYRTRSVPVVGICLDGTDPSYLEAASGVMPNLTAMAAKGSRGVAQSVIPSFTNPNNIAMATGVPPSVNGICGNYYYDQVTGVEVMMNDPKYLRCPTIFSAVGEAGVPVAVVTAKDKLRLLLGHGLKGICFSVEGVRKGAVPDKARRIVEKMSQPAPDIYDPEISVYCIEAGVRLLETEKIGLAYLTTTDFVQHKYKPGSAEANAFYARIDHFIGCLDQFGAIVAITADHGMNDKVNPDGSPKVQFLETLLVDAGFREARVILPITDPYVVHHGALGSYATVYLGSGSIDDARGFLGKIPGVELVLDRSEAAKRFQLPADRIGDFVVLADRSTTLGRTPSWHDLSVVESGLRSHGGLHEQRVPFIFNRQLQSTYADRLAAGEARNFDLFDFALNGVQD